MFPSDAPFTALGPAPAIRVRAQAHPGSLSRCPTGHCHPTPSRHGLPVWIAPIIGCRRTPPTPPSAPLTADGKMSGLCHRTTPALPRRVGRRIRSVGAGRCLSVVGQDRGMGVVHGYFAAVAERVHRPGVRGLNALVGCGARLRPGARPDAGAGAKRAGFSPWCCADGGGGRRRRPRVRAPRSNRRGVPVSKASRPASSSRCRSRWTCPCCRTPSRAACRRNGP